MKLNLTKELGMLMKFVSKAGTAIRMNSTYSGQSNPDDVMWLSDSLHNLEFLAEVIVVGDVDRISEESASLIDTFTFYATGLKPGQSMKSDPKETFEKYMYIDLQNVVGVLMNINREAERCRLAA